MSENIGPKHLINRKTVAKRAENMLWFKAPRSVYFRRGCVVEALKEFHGLKRALLVTDGFLFRNGNAEPVIDLLKLGGLEVEVFYQVEADPTLAQVRKGVEIARAFQPDLIVAFGGGSPMDAAKILWVMYEHPEVLFEDLAMRFMDIRKRIYHFPKMGIKAQFVAIPTTSGTGSEVTPFAVVTDEATGIKYPIADYELMPNMAIVDANFVMHLPRTLTAAGGLDAVTHSIEAYVSILANEFTDGQALHALKLLKEHLPAAYESGAHNPVARERVHSAATIAGIAFANAFLGVCHSLAHKLGSAFHITHGIANALLLANVIRYNANDNPTKQAAFSQYDRPKAKCRYAEIAAHLGLPGSTKEEQVESLVVWFESLNRQLGVPASIRELGIPEAEFLARVDAIALDAFDDQCTGANPRYPLVEELKAILLDSYYGRPFVEIFARHNLAEEELAVALR